MTPNSMDIRHPRALVLRIYWDGAEVPSVEVSLGDLFAVGNGMRASVNSLPVKVSSYGRGYNCYWQMPLRKEAGRLGPRVVPAIGLFPVPRRPMRLPPLLPLPAHRCPPFSGSKFRAR
jgi:hypothetical protein